MKNSEGYPPPLQCHYFNMALFLGGWLVGGGLKARELQNLFPKDREIGVDAVDGEVHEKSWLIFLGKFGGVIMFK